MQIICLITALFWESSCNLKDEGNANIPCGFPGRPKWGDVVVSYDKSNSLQQIATYNCPGSYLIDEDVERRCENGKWTGTIPRCAMPLSASVTEENNIVKWETLTDNNRGTCQWIRGNSSLHLKYSKTYNVTSVTIISPLNTKVSFQNSKWQMNVTFGNFEKSYTNGLFQEREVDLANDQFSSIQWRSNDFGDAVQLSLVRGEAYVCEVQVHGVPDKCGEAEQPINGRIDYDVEMFGPNRKEGAACRCHSGYEVSSSASTGRLCDLGTWQQEQCICQTSEFTMLIILYALIASFSAFVLVSLCIFTCLACRKSHPDGNRSNPSTRPMMPINENESQHLGTQKWVE